MIEKRGGREQLNPDLGQLIGDRTEDRCGIPLLQSREEEHRLKFGPQGEEIAWRNLARHDRVPDIGFSKKMQKFAELTDAQPFDLVGAILDFR
jgi:hypothetical protein